MRNLWADWQLFKKTDFTNPSLQLKKQGIMSKTDQYAEFTYRPNSTSPPSMQEFYESIINGIIKRFQLGLYQGEFQYYIELQSCLHEFIRLMNFKSEILVEVFQSITNLNLSKEPFPNVVVPCASCGMFIYVVSHCNKCYSAFYCDKTCMKNGRTKHDSECQSFVKTTPLILYPLQIEIHCGGSLGDDVKIYFQSEKKLTLLYRGQKFLAHMYKILLKNRWIKNNNYQTIQEEDHIILQSTKKVDHNKNEEGDTNFSEDDLFLRMPCVQEVKVIFLNQGAILQDIIKETYNFYTNFTHIYFFPI